MNLLINLPIDLINLILNYIKNIDDIYNLRLTNKKFYNIYKSFPIYENELPIYLIYFNNNNIIWYQYNSEKKVKEIIFEPYGGIKVKDYRSNNTNIDYKFNLPLSFNKTIKNIHCITKYSYNIKYNQHQTQIIPIYKHHCQIF